MPADLLTTIHLEITARLAALRPQLTEYDRLKAAAAALERLPSGQEHEPPRPRLRIPRAASLAEVVETVRDLPYGRPSDRTVDGMLRERRGTCSTKHLYLTQLLSNRFPNTHPRLVHRVYHLSRASAHDHFGVDIAEAVPVGGLMDVHRYLTIVVRRRITVDATFPASGVPWDGRTPMDLACGPGRDFIAGDNPDDEKRALEDRYCDPSIREPFISALTGARLLTLAGTGGAQSASQPPVIVS